MKKKATEGKNDNKKGNNVILIFIFLCNFAHIILKS